MPHRSIHIVAVPGETMNAYPGIMFLIGLVIIILGAELVLLGAARFAALLGIKPIIIGLTIVAIGTSTPELAIGIKAVAEGQSPMAVGTIAGTNIVNLLLILGLSAAIRPLPLALQTIKLDAPVMVASALGLFVMAMDGVLSRRDGAMLLLAAVAYTIALVIQSRRESSRIRQEFNAEYGPRHRLSARSVKPGLWNLLLQFAGMLLTAIGASLMVDGAVNIAGACGISGAIIGLPIVAIGTSAPELVTTIMATLRNDRDVAVGNLIGSAISNILVILGLICVTSPHGVEISADLLAIDLPLTVLVALLCVTIFRRDHMMTRRDGLVFVATYLSYLASLIWIRA